MSVAIQTIPTTYATALSPNHNDHYQAQAGPFVSGGGDTIKSALDRMTSDELKQTMDELNGFTSEINDRNYRHNAHSFFRERIQKASGNTDSDRTDILASLVNQYSGVIRNDATIAEVVGGFRNALEDTWNRKRNSESSTVKYSDTEGNPLSSWRPSTAPSVSTAAALSDTVDQKQQHQESRAVQRYAPRPSSASVTPEAAQKSTALSNTVPSEQDTDVIPEEQRRWLEITPEHHRRLREQGRLALTQYPRDNEVEVGDTAVPSFLGQSSAITKKPQLREDRLSLFSPKSMFQDTRSVLQRLGLDTSTFVCRSYTSHTVVNADGHGFHHQQYTTIDSNGAKEVFRDNASW